MLCEPPRLLPGFGYGERLPAVMLVLACPAMSAGRRQELSDSFIAMLDSAAAGAAKPFDAGDFAETREGGADWFLALIGHVQALAGLPDLAAPRVIERSADADRCIVPALHHAVPPLAELARLLSTHIGLPEEDARRLAVAQAAARNFAALRISPYRAYLYEAAVGMRIAVQQLSDLAFQYGIGRHSVLMDSTITEHTSSIGARLARRKMLSAAALRRLGLPVPDHRLAASADDAVKIAGQLSYPVVVKPADLDGGEGVAADLRSEAEVRMAFADASKLSSRVLVEKHVPGNDYRLVVFRGRLIWAYWREPGGVTGDGRRSVAQLVTDLNSDPARGEGNSFELRRLDMDREATVQLDRQRLSADSVPEAGRFVRLRGAANIDRGGRPVDVLDKVHPDNARLAAMAADVLRLDLAGVDVLLPDIARSWRETGGAICEINAQPQISGEQPQRAYRLILEELLGGDGNIPVFATLGGERARAISRRIEGHLSTPELGVGRYGDDGVFLNGETLLAGSVPLLRGVRLLSSRRELDRLVFAIGDDSVLGTGLPLPHIDTLVLSGEAVGPSGPQSGAEPGVRMGRLLEMIAPACGRVLLACSPEDCAPELCAVLERIAPAYELVDEAAICSRLEAGNEG